MKDLNIPKMPVYEAERMVGSGYFFCNYFDEIGEVGDGCGKSCEGYEPRNKIKGICKHSIPTYEQTDKMIMLKTNKTL